MKFTVDQDALTEILADVAKVCIEPYHKFVVQLAKDGRIREEELDQLLEQLRGQVEQIAEIVTKRLFRESG